MSKEICDYNDILKAIEDKRNEFFSENIIMFSGKQRQSVYIKKMYDPDFQERFIGSFPDKDLYISCNCFKPSGKIQGKATNDNLSHVYMWCVDVDYKKGCNEAVNPLEMAMHILEICPWIPEPTFIEYSNNFRFIYILSEPIVCSSKGAFVMKKALRFVQEAVVRRINAELDAHAEIQPLTSFIRVPGSINTRNNSIVKLARYADTLYSVQELLTDYMPTLPVADKKAYRRMKSKKKKKASTSPYIKNRQFSIAKLQNARMADYRKLREVKGIPRELLCHLYITAWKCMNPDGDHINELLKFNKGFPCPLQEKEIRSKFRIVKTYKYANKYIIEKLGITDEIIKELGLFIRMQKQKSAPKRSYKRIKNAEENYQTVKRLYEKGVCRKEIAKTTGFSLSMIRKAITKINKGFAHYRIEEKIRLILEKLVATAMQKNSRHREETEKQNDMSEGIVRPVVSKQTDAWETAYIAC